MIYCFDCDDFDTKTKDSDFLKKAKEYCKENGYEFVWFCRDIEQVYIGKQVDNNQKKKEAVTFKSGKLIKKVNVDRLCETNYRVNRSNFMTVLDQFQEFTRK